MPFLQKLERNFDNGVTHTKFREIYLVYDNKLVWQCGGAVLGHLRSKF